MLTALTWPVQGFNEARKFAGKLGAGQLDGAPLAPHGVATTIGFPSLKGPVTTSTDR